MLLNALKTLTDESEEAVSKSVVPGPVYLQETQVSSPHGSLFVKWFLSQLWTDVASGNLPNKDEQADRAKST